MNLRRVALAVLASAVVIGAARPAAAQWGPSYSAVKGMDESFRIDLGGFFQKFDTTVQLDSSSLGPGTEISLESDFGQNANKTSFRADGYLRFGRHGNLQFSFLTWNRSASTTLARDIQFGDHVYHAGATASSELRITDAELYYGYSLVNTGETEFGLMLGASTLFNTASLDASGYVTGPGGTTSGSVSSDSKSIVAPIPAVGAYFRFTLLPGFFLEARAKGLPRITISGHSGSMIDTRAGLGYFFTQNVGVGATYSYTEIKYSYAGSYNLAFDYKYSGPYVYLSLAF
ncbi:MAG: hypothetical protein ACHQPI_13185 [Thermoanaerobaculia bacterium]